MTGSDEISRSDLDVLRGLAERTMQIAHSPENLERKEQWYKLDAGADSRVMVLAETFGIRDVNSPMVTMGYKCKAPRALIIEAGLLYQIHQFEVLKDDHVVEPYYNVAWKINVSDYGVQPIEHTTENQGRMTSKKWDPPIKDLDKDFDKLRPRTWSVDREGTHQLVEDMEKIFGDVLPVRIRGMFGGIQWSLGMTEPVMKLHGLDNLMINTIDNPDGLHRLMKFLCDDHVAYAEWLESEGLLSLNNENDYIGSGSMGYTHELPRSGKDDVRMEDQWVLMESQETIGVGPKHFEEIFFPYQLELVKRFGKCYYGCCEPVNNRWHILKTIPNLSRVSISPWADEEFMAEELGADFVYSRKPSPALISSERFNEDEIRADIRTTLDKAKGCRIEIVMKDVHTLNNEPERLPRWVEIAREEIGKME